MSKDAKPRSIWTPANIVTVVRICLVPVFVAVLLSPWPEWLGLKDVVSNGAKSLFAACVFILISCTDWIDGYLARSRNEVTDFGKLMDPLADKILVAAALLALIELQVLPSWPVLIILAREFIVSGVRMLAASRGIVIAASWYGKAKTVLQIAAIVLFLVKDTLYIPDVQHAIENPLYIISWLVMLVALFFTIASMMDYISKAWPLIKSVQESNDDEDAEALASKLISLSTEKGLTLSTAESLTGGMISTCLTSVPGSSASFIGGVVSYAISAKENVLGVDEHLLSSRGAVDGDVAIQMARGVRKQMGSSLSVSVTGIAGPSGAEPEKPVGTVFVGFASDREEGFIECHFSGDREEVRIKTTCKAMDVLIGLVDG
ncbi:MAG: CDP-diacylglycerol--glycerol-3-phosphate 3-phosphatidyltransferase [Eggerthellaceae bacterium]|nr:CDP-diacylglycerol--glycerol-3-phosphate 3-phosphatidyltransferase [Eggerthellaceae bacterium]